MQICFIGGGNMAGALINGLLRANTAAASITAIEIDAARRTQLQHELGIRTLRRAGRLDSKAPTCSYLP